MHNRRLGALLTGAWLIGNVLVWFVTTQSFTVVNRIVSTPSVPVRKQFAELKADAATLLLEHQANEINRNVTEAWEMLQIGIAAALLATSVFTPHRSKTSIACAIVLATLASLAAFWLTPQMNALGRSLDFVPPAEALRERALHIHLNIWHKALLIVQSLAALVLAARLVFDFYEFREAFRHSGRERQRKYAGVARS